MLSGSIPAGALSATTPSLTRIWSYGSSWADDLAVDSSGNITIVGAMQNVTDLGDALLLRYNATGSLILQRLWRGPNYQEATGVAVDALGNAYLTGGTSSFGNGHFHIFLLKFGPAGKLLWQVIWGGSDTAEGSGVTLNPFGGILVTGLTFNLTSPGVTPNPPSDGVVLEFNSTGSLQTQIVWTGLGGSFGRVVADPSGNIYTASRMSLLKFNSSGGLIWARSWSGMTGGNFPADISLDAGGNIYLSGIGPTTVSPRSIFLLKLDKNGALLWQRRWESSSWTMGYEGVTANATSIIYVTADMMTCVPNPRGCTQYEEPLILEFNSTGSLLGQLALQGYGFGSLGRPSTDSAGSLYLAGQGGLAGVSFCTPIGGLTTSSVSLIPAVGQVLNPSYSAMPALGSVSTPRGSETSQSGVVLMKFDSGIMGGSVTCSAVPVFPLTLPMVTLMGLLIILQARRRLHRSLERET